jgi:hypothetical protein
MNHSAKRKRKTDVLARVARPNHMYAYCRILGCANPATAGTQKGLNRLYCRKHEDHYERHGSYFKRSYTAARINPYRRAALRWLRANEADPVVTSSLDRILFLYNEGGRKIDAFRLAGLPPSERARAAWARLRDAEVDPKQPLAAWLAVELVLLDDPQAERKTEFKRVQAAKLVHRMASGTHKRWDNPWSGGGFGPVELHKYPASRGRVLRHLGQQLERAAELLVDQRLNEIQRLVRSGGPPGFLAPPKA